MADVLHHLAFNAGQPARVPRAAVPDGAVEALGAVLDAEAGAAPGFEGWFLDVRQPRDESGRRGSGAAYFQLAEEPGNSRRPALMAFACWQDEPSAETWDQALAAYGALRPALAEAGLWRAPPRRVPALPWLATWLTPLAREVEGATLDALAQLARYTAWTLAGR